MKIHNDFDYFKHDPQKNPKFITTIQILHPKPARTSLNQLTKILSTHNERIFDNPLSQLLQRLLLPRVSLTQLVSGFVSIKISVHCQENEPTNDKCSLSRATIQNENEICVARENEN
jgi:hypothetical protein